MQQAELNEFLAYLDQIANATETGQIVWSQNNPTTFVWHSKPKTNARIILQQVSSGLFLLQGLDETSTPRINFHGSFSNNANQKMANIFKAIEKKRDRQSLDFLKSLLPQ